MTRTRSWIGPLLAGLVTLAAITLLTMYPAAAAHAATPDAPVWSSCPNLKNWLPNEDEQDRRPTPTVDGLKFAGDQLVHHPVAMDLKDVHPGTYAATPAPSLVDFFSLEVYSTVDPHGYATLRYEAAGPNAGQWNIGGTNFYGTDPAQLAADHNRSTNVVSFGVGYVATPATGTETVVSSVTFHGVTYPLTCKPTATPSKTPKPSTSASNPHHVSQTPAPPADGPNGTSTGALAVTGPSGWWIGAVAVGLAAFGGVLLIAARRRRTTFRS